MVLGRFVSRLIVDPVYQMRKTIGEISQFLLENLPTISNPGVPSEEVMQKTSSHLKKLSAELQAHTYLVPCYVIVAWIFRLPKRDKILVASNELRYLSNSVFKCFSANIYERNAKAVEKICDSLGIYWADENRWPKD